MADWIVVVIIAVLAAYSILITGIHWLNPLGTDYRTLYEAAKADRNAYKEAYEKSRKQVMDFRLAAGTLFAGDDKFGRFINENGTLVLQAFVWYADDVKTVQEFKEKEERVNEFIQSR